MLYFAILAASQTNRFTYKVTGFERNLSHKSNLKQLIGIKLVSARQTYYKGLLKNTVTKNTSLWKSKVNRNHFPRISIESELKKLESPAQTAIEVWYCQGRLKKTRANKGRGLFKSPGLFPFVRQYKFFTGPPRLHLPTEQIVLGRG